MTCIYCNTDVTESDRLSTLQHRSCYDEWNRRVDEKLCVNCCKPLEQADVDSDSKHHEQCPLAGSFPGYPYSQITA